MACHCGSDQPYELCCQPFIKKEKYPLSALQLMKSRFSAYVEHEIQYLLDTCDSPKPQHNFENLSQWAKQNTWLNLEIISTTLGGKAHQNGQVEFKAHYLDQKGKKHVHHELSTFEKKDDKWFYTEGIQNPKAFEELGKTNRNAPCPCGSGLKYKKCCG